MKQRLLNNLLLIFMCTLSCSLTAQETQVKEKSKNSKGKSSRVKEATENFGEYAFVDAREIYSRVAERGFTSPEVLKKLGDSYYLTAEYKEASKWYGRLLGTASDSLDAEYYFRYAQSLKSMKRYDLADTQMDIFNRLNGDDSRAERYIAERDYLKEIEAQSGRYSIGKVSFNSELQDFGPSYYGEDLVFSSNHILQK